MERNNWNVSFKIQEASHETFPKSAGLVSHVRLIRSLWKTLGKIIGKIVQKTKLGKPSVCDIQWTNRIVFEPVSNSLRIPIGQRSAGNSIQFGSATDRE